MDTVRIIHLGHLPVTLLWIVGVVLAIRSFQRHRIASSLVIGAALCYFAALGLSASLRNIVLRQI